MLCTFIDLLYEITKISLIFQWENVTLSSAIAKLKNANECLRYLNDHDGENLLEFKNSLVNSNAHKSIT